MNDLNAFVRARLDDEERVAREADDDNTEFGTGPSSWTDPYSEFHGRSSNPEFAHVLRHDPARVLAEVDAKRRILDWHTTPHTVVDGFCVEEGGPCTHAGEAACTACGQEPCHTVRLLALPHADHPDYREEWRP